MFEKIKNLFVNNLGLKISALVLAVLVWAAITGRERAYSERTLRIPIEVANVSENIEVRSVRPEEVSMTLRGISRLMGELSKENLKVRIDLRDTVKSGRINFYAEDNIEIPEGVHIISIHPKMIEINVEEFVSREVPVKVHFIGRLKAGLTLKETRVIPEKVLVIGYRLQIADVDSVSTEPLNLAGIENTTSLKIGLKKTGSILRFPDRREVEVFLEIGGTANEK